MWYDDDVEYNRYENLDGIEDKIIYYLLSEQNKNDWQLKAVHNIWRLLYYNNAGCLLDDEEHPLPKFSNIAKMIDNNSLEQANKRIFRAPFVEDAFTDECTQLRIYVDGISPQNHLLGTISIGIEVIIHNKLTNVINNLYDKNDNLINPTEEYPLVTYKNRATVLLKNIIALLNGVDIAGVGKMKFTQENNRFCQSKLGVWNNRNYYGYRSIFTCMMSGVS
jgi:hypothetical protein